MKKFILRTIAQIRLIDYILAFCVLGAIIASLLLFTRKQVTVYVDLTSVPQPGNSKPLPPQYTEVDELYG